MIVYGSQKTTAFYLSELKCENLINPLGIDNVTPHFSWKLKGNGWKGGQTYYEIQVASDSILLTQDRADLWNTGKLKSNVSVMVPYQGKALTSRSLCYWRVRVWDAKKQVSSWSPVARFGVGILNKSQMQGDYIGASIEGGKICAPILRKKSEADSRGDFFPACKYVRLSRNLYQWEKGGGGRSDPCCITFI